MFVVCFPVHSRVPVLAHLLPIALFLLLYPCMACSLAEASAFLLVCSYFNSLCPTVFWGGLHCNLHYKHVVGPKRELLMRRCIKVR